MSIEMLTRRLSAGSAATLLKAVHGLRPPKHLLSLGARGVCWGQRRWPPRPSALARPEAPAEARPRRVLTTLSAPWSRDERLLRAHRESGPVLEPRRAVLRRAFSSPLSPLHLLASGLPPGLQNASILMTHTLPGHVPGAVLAHVTPILPRRKLRHRAMIPPLGVTTGLRMVGSWLCWDWPSEAFGCTCV